MDKVRNLAPAPKQERSVSSSRAATFTAPSLSEQQGAQVAAILQERLVSLTDLALTLKHIHWNVVGPNFIAVHEMLDPQYAGVSKMVDDLAERIATLGAVPSGLAGKLVQERTWDDYAIDRADAIAHLGALDLVYRGVIGAHRDAVDRTEDPDPISQDLLIQQTGVLERYHWFVRSHLADYAGGMANAGARTEEEAARAVAAKTGRGGKGPAARRTV